jgi:hypothetical protein
MWLDSPRVPFILAAFILVAFEVLMLHTGPHDAWAACRAAVLRFLQTLAMWMA